MLALWEAGKHPVAYAPGNLFKGGIRMNTKAKKSTYTFDVVCGPNLDRLLDAFKYAYDFNAKVPVAFVIAEH